MTPEKFIEKWKAVELKERAAAQSHFIDLCHMLDEPAPTDVDPVGEWYAFERGASKTTGGDGWADVWKRGHFGWEYKGKRKDLDAAFAQLQQYALALENPPLLVVCDMDRFRIHTNWTNSVSEVLEFDLDGLRDPSNRERLKWVFSNPDKLKPQKTRQALTEDAAAEFSSLAQRLRARGHDAETVAHFINRIVFCMFAEDVDLLPNKMFQRLLEHSRAAPEEFQALASDLFRAMSAGGRVGFEHVAWFNGGLFNDEVALPLERADIDLTLRIASLDWAEIDPSILGTLFERGLDPSKRSQLGAHYTDRDKIMQIITPVIEQPLAELWETTKRDIAGQMSLASEARERRPKKQADARKVYAAARRAEESAMKAAEAIYLGFLHRLKQFRVLDPACGSGNFLYLALTSLKNIEHRANIEAELLGMSRQVPSVGPEAVLGIEINPYAAELARVSVWIGEIQWMRRNGFNVSRNPILKPLDTIECRDALLNRDGSLAAWPKVDVIVGNPPFLGNKKMIRELGEGYVTSVRAAYEDTLPRAGDFVCFWFAKAWNLIESGDTKRCGLVATNSIRSGSSNDILMKIVANGRIFDAWDDEPWVVDGAAVRVSLICFDAGGEGPVRLNNEICPLIRPNLTAAAIDLTLRKTLSENLRVCFVGVILNGNFELDGDSARQMLLAPRNVNGRPNSDVIRPTLNGDDFNSVRPDKWVIDFGTAMSREMAAQYELPYRRIEEFVRPYR